MTRARVRRLASQGSSCAATASSPGFASPTALSMPPRNSATRGAGWPRRASGVTAFVTIPPKASRSMTPATSRPKPAVPAASKTGFWKVTPSSRTAVRSASSAGPPDGQAALELEEVGHDTVGDRARDSALARRRGEERTVLRVCGEAGLDQDRRPARRGEHQERALLHTTVVSGMDHRNPPLDQLGEPRRFAQVFIHL